MADTPHHMEGLAKLVPEAYYDIIARVPPGVIFLGMLASDPYFVQPPLTLRDINSSLIVAIILVGYTIGIVLSGLGVWIATWLWIGTWKWSNKRDSELASKFEKAGADGGKSFGDKLAFVYQSLCDEANRGVLNKLSAEAALCANLVIAFVLLLLVQCYTKRMDLSPRSIIIYAGGMLSLIVLLTRQYNATKRQKTLLRAKKSPSGENRDVPLPRRDEVEIETD